MLTNCSLFDNCSKIPALKRRIGGKRAFHEQIVIERSRKYQNKIKDMLLPPFVS